MIDRYIGVVKIIEGDELPFLDYVKLSRFVEFLDKTRWSSESITFAHVVVCLIMDLFEYIKSWDIEKKISFCAYLRNVYHIKHRTYIEFAEWIINNYSEIFGISFSDVVDMFTVYCMIKYGCEPTDIVRFEKEVWRR